MTLKYLITGATGGLGGGVLQQISKHVPKLDYAASSSRPEAATQFGSSGIQFRHVDYRNQASLEKAFAGVEKLLFVSANTYDNEARNQQHRNVIEAASRAAVGHVYYTSLAWGGHSSDSKIDVQQAHYVCEAMLKESGITYTSVREGIYAEAFPLFLNYYPSSQILRLPADGAVAYASRAELAEATANLMMRGGHEKEIVLLTGPKAVTLADLVETINAVTGRRIAVETLPFDKYVKGSAENDEGSKSEWWFEKRISWYDGIAKGDGKAVDPSMEQLLGRKPKDGTEVVREILAAEPNYTWHQNYAKK